MVQEPHSNILNGDAIAAEYGQRHMAFPLMDNKFGAKEITRTGGVALKHEVQREVYKKESKVTVTTEEQQP
jgi:hypothetical protein